MDGPHLDGPERARGHDRAGRHSERGPRRQAPLPKGHRVARRARVLTAGPAGGVAELSEALLRGDSRALARAMSLVENGAPEAEALLDKVYGRRPAAPRLGITGPPGAGKSTLVTEYARLLRRMGRRVGVVAV